MKLVRFESGQQMRYGVWEDDIVKEVTGSIYRGLPHQLHNPPDRRRAPAGPGGAHQDSLCRPELPRPHRRNRLAHAEVPRPLPEAADDADRSRRPHRHSRGSPNRWITRGKLAAVIKRQIKDVSLEEASQAILGYTCLNDITERPLSMTQGQLTRSKGFDTFAPVGPCIATGLDPSRLVLRTRLNGTLMQEASLARHDLQHPVPRAVPLPVHDTVPRGHHQRRHAARGRGHETRRCRRGVRLTGSVSCGTPCVPPDPDAGTGPSRRPPAPVSI